MIQAGWAASVSFCSARNATSCLASSRPWFRLVPSHYKTDPPGSSILFLLEELVPFPSQLEAPQEVHLIWFLNIQFLAISLETEELLTDLQAPLPLRDFLSGAVPVYPGDFSHLEQRDWSWMPLRKYVIVIPTIKLIYDPVCLSVCHVVFSLQ